MANNIMLPPINQIIKGIFEYNDNLGQKRQPEHPPSYVYTPMQEATHSLQQMSFNPHSHCHCVPSANYRSTSEPSNAVGNRRRTLSASMDNAAYTMHHFQNNTHKNQQDYWTPNTMNAYMPHHINMPSHPPIERRRARAHTTSGYPPTLLNQAKIHYPLNEHTENVFLPNMPQMMTMRSTNKSNNIHHRYHCHHCDKSFSRPSSLRIHIYSHTGEKPFKCQFADCGKSFSVHSNMRRHLRVHFCSSPQHDNSELHTGLGSTSSNNSSMRLPIVPVTNMPQ
ncbi:hypothetical protein BDB01DRAFT_43966 [Pilobolus umbonatus]|nr:hypothetical protein BDB01DRAFT_43966 [Pilobolus umbonatus]